MKRVLITLAWVVPDGIIMLLFTNLGHAWGLTDLVAHLLGMLALITGALAWCGIDCLRNRHCHDLTHTDQARV